RPAAMLTLPSSTRGASPARITVTSASSDVRGASRSLAVISGPMPDGSPGKRPMRGFTWTASLGDNRNLPELFELPPGDIGPGAGRIYFQVCLPVLGGFQKITRLFAK